MNNFFLKLAIILTTILMLTHIDAGAQILIPSEEANNKITPDRLKTQVEFLSDTICSGRATGTKGMQEANFWLIHRFRDIGIVPFRSSYISHFYTETGPIGRNVMGFIPSNGGYSNNYTIVMAHYDGLGLINDTFYPGADSNASGVVALLSIAEMFRVMIKYNKKYNGNIIFVATDAKRLNMYGAEAIFYLIHDGYLTNPITGMPITMKNISLVVNIDQIGSTLSPIHTNMPEYLIMLGNHSLKHSCRDYLALCNYNLNLDIGYDYYGSRDFTNLFYNSVCEQKIFAKEKIPTVLFTSGITDNNNKKEDNADSLNYDVFRKRIILIFRWLEKIIQVNQR